MIEQMMFAGINKTVEDEFFEYLDHQMWVADAFSEFSAELKRRFRVYQGEACTGILPSAWCIDYSPKGVRILGNDGTETHIKKEKILKRYGIRYGASETTDIMEADE